MDEPFGEISKSRQSSRSGRAESVFATEANEKSKVEDKLICKPIQSFHR
jgi:hypothetical protein